jgi:hypothetical protein
MMKLSFTRTATGMEDPELPLLQRIPASVTSLRNCSPNICFRVQVTDASQHQVFRADCMKSGLHGQIAAKKPLLKDTKKKKRHAWVKKHEQWTLDWWKSVLWSDVSKFPTMKHGGGGVMSLRDAE